MDGLAGMRGPSPRLVKTTTLHPHASFDFGPPDKVATEFKIEPKDKDGNPVAVHCLRFSDPDGESHVILLSDEGKASLVESMTSGVWTPP